MTQPTPRPPTPGQPTPGPPRPGPARPAASDAPPAFTDPADPLAQVGEALSTLASVPLDERPEVFASIDRQLRSALDAGASPGRS